MRIKLDAGKLRSILFNSGMSQTELANVTGLSRVTVSSIFNGRSCSDETAKRICNALKIELEDAR